MNRGSVLAVNAPDPVDIRLLSLLADLGRAGVPELANRLGLDPREVAARLVNLSASGLPLLVGAECDPPRIRSAVAHAINWQQRYGARIRPPQPPEDSWGPPQSASWTRGDQPPSAHPGTGTVGDTLTITTGHGELLSIQLVELVDPADFLFSAGGYNLDAGERSVIVHTELTNKGTAAFEPLPDEHLVLVAEDGQTIARASVGLSSRPAHRPGLAPGQTAGGHTVYVLPEDLGLTHVRWGTGPDPDSPGLSWRVRD